MEDKEISFWMNNTQFEIPFIKECGMNWEEILDDYNQRMEREKQLGIDKIREIFFDEVKGMDEEDIEKFMDGELPSKLQKIVSIDPKNYNFISKEYPDIVIGTIYDILDRDNNANDDYYDFESFF